MTSISILLLLNLCLLCVPACQYYSTAQRTQGEPKRVRSPKTGVTGVGKKHRVVLELNPDPLYEHQGPTLQLLFYFLIIFFNSCYILIMALLPPFLPVLPSQVFHPITFSPLPIEGAALPWLPVCPGTPS